MNLQKLELSYMGKMIFCRTCQQGKKGDGAARDLESKGGIDIHCADCINNFRLVGSTPNFASPYDRN